MHTSVLDHYCFKILCLDYEARQSYVALKLAVLGSAVPLTNGKYVTGFAKRDLFDKLQKLSLAAIQVPLGLPFIVT